MKLNWLFWCRTRFLPLGQAGSSWIPERFFFFFFTHDRRWFILVTNRKWVQFGIRGQWEVHLRRCDASLLQYYNRIVQMCNFFWKVCCRNQFLCCCLLYSPVIIQWYHHGFLYLRVNIQRLLSSFNWHKGDSEMDEFGFSILFCQLLDAVDSWQECCCCCKELWGREMRTSRLCELKGMNQGALCVSVCDVLWPGSVFSWT